MQQSVSIDAGFLVNQQSESVDDEIEELTMHYLEPIDYKPFIIA